MVKTTILKSIYFNESEKKIQDWIFNVIKCLLVSIEDTTYFRIWPWFLYLVHMTQPINVY